MLVLLLYMYLANEQIMSKYCFNQRSIRNSMNLYDSVVRCTDLNLIYTGVMDL